MINNAIRMPSYPYMLCFSCNYLISLHNILLFIRQFLVYTRFFRSNYLISLLETPSPSIYLYMRTLRKCMWWSSQNLIVYTVEHYHYPAGTKRATSPKVFHFETPLFSWPWLPPSTYKDRYKDLGDSVVVSRGCEDYLTYKDRFYV